MERLRANDYGVTSLDGEGAAGAVQVIFTIVPRREVGTVVALVRAFNPKAFYSIEEVGFAKEGVFPIRKDSRFIGMGRFLRPFRKGK